MLSLFALPKLYIIGSSYNNHEKCSRNPFPAERKFAKMWLSQMIKNNCCQTRTPLTSEARSKSTQIKRLAGPNVAKPLKKPGVNFTNILCTAFPY